MQWVGSMTSSHALQISMIPASLVRAAKHELASHSVADRRQHDGKHGGLQLLGQQLSGGCRRRAKGRTATIWLRERMVGIMLAPMSISTSVDTVAISFPPHIALTPISADERPGSVYWGRGLIVWGWPGGERARCGMHWNSRSATGGKRVALSSGQAVAGSADGGLAGGRMVVLPCLLL
ncbi:hypothetical protein B0H14DRAFT_3759654 [Mycena olivaceomarginata]|nr:hypothetical protein B0H14DRAFT_3759654 [Mycena olivaceomarginata]